MTLWDLLTVISFLMPITGAMDSAKLAHTGYGGYAAALILSVVLGIAFGWAVRVSAVRVFQIVGDKPRGFLKWLYLVSYLCAVALWPFIGLFMGGWASEPVFALLR